MIARQVCNERLCFRISKERNDSVEVLVRVPGKTQNKRIQILQMTHRMRVGWSREGVKSSNNVKAPKCAYCR